MLLSSDLRGKKILLTGAYGFIGSHLRERLQGLDLDARMWTSDVTELQAFNEPVDWVVHLAAAGSHQKFVDDMQGSYKTNVVGTLAVLDYCRRSNAKCIFTSTSGLYKESINGIPVSETSKIEPSHPYALSKWMGEEICKLQSTALDVSVTVLRLFNVYGQGQASTVLVPYILNCIEQGVPIKLRSPNAIRDFVYVKDVVEALIRSLGITSETYSLYNVGTGKPTKVIELVHVVQEIYGKEVDIQFTDLQEGELPTVIADIDKANKELGWSPAFDLYDGLSDMIVHGSLR